MKKSELRQIIREEISNVMDEEFKVGDMVRINKNITRFDKEAHGFEVGQEEEITAIYGNPPRAKITPSNFSIALKALDRI